MKHYSAIESSGIATADCHYWKTILELASSAGAQPSSVNDVLLTITLFPNVLARRKELATYSCVEFLDVISETSAPTKEQLPLASMCTYADEWTGKGSLKHDQNVRAITGIAVDIDESDDTPKELSQLFRDLDIAHLWYSSSRHGIDGNCCRFMFPTSRELPPSAHRELVGRVNGILSGRVDPASFTLSQGYFYGRAERVRSKRDGKLYKCKPVKSDFHDSGRCIDQCSELPIVGPPEKLASGQEGGEGPIGLTLEETRQCLALVPHWVDERKTWMRVGMAVKEEHGEAGYPIWGEWSQNSDKYDEEVNREQWQTYGRRKTGRRVTMATILGELRDRGYGGKVVGPILSRIERAAVLADLIGGDEDEPSERSSRLTFLSPSECAILPTRQYVIKGVLAEGDVACIFGAPGAGKSLLAPFLAYKVAQGETAFGMRTKQGGTLYVSAEDQTGMRMRVTASRNQLGEADDFHLVCGVSDLLSEGSPDLRELQRAVAEHKPRLIIIDTLAMAFPGLDENSADGMGRVIRVCRLLAKHGAAVVLIHHDTKAASGTPRGHSVLNGALDMAMRIEHGADGIVCATLTKNRNGPCNIDIAFKIGVETLGEDSDGDSITAAYCQPCDGCGGERLPRLTETEADIWHMIRDAGPSGMTSKTGRREYMRKRDGEPSDTVSKAWRRGVKGVLLKKRVIKEGSRFFDAKSHGERENQFDERDDELI